MLTLKAINNALIREVIRERRRLTVGVRSLIVCKCKRCNVGQRFAVDGDALQFVESHGVHSRIEVYLVDPTGRLLAAWGSFG